jgi:hypothetical protein
MEAARTPATVMRIAVRGEPVAARATDEAEIQRHILIEFVGALSTHPDLHVVTEDGLLRNLPERAAALVDEFLEKRAEHGRQTKIRADPFRSTWTGYRLVSEP